jgi:polyhydroxyalkanoate synthesis regulator phasin
VAPNTPPHASNRQRSAARQKHLDDLKRQIQTGQYETDEKLDLTLRRMLDDLRGLTEQTASREDESGGESP